jgi:hypothetical protein
MCFDIDAGFMNLSMHWIGKLMMVGAKTGMAVDALGKAAADSAAQ